MRRLTEGFEESIERIDSLIERSSGRLIDFGRQRYWFNRNAAVQAAHLREFEDSHGLTIPSDLGQFLTTVGSCTLFADELLPGIEILAPWQWEGFTAAVLHNTGASLFPDVVLTVSLRRDGSVAGFRTPAERDSCFGEFYPDIPAEFWISDTRFTSFSAWLAELMDLLRG